MVLLLPIRLLTAVCLACKQALRQLNLWVLKHFGSSFPLKVLLLVFSPNPKIPSFSFHWCSLWVWVDCKESWLENQGTYQSSPWVLFLLTSSQSVELLSLNYFHRKNCLQSVIKLELLLTMTLILSILWTAES